MSNLRQHRPVVPAELLRPPHRHRRLEKRAQAAAHIRIHADALLRGVPLARVLRLRQGLALRGCTALARVVDPLVKALDDETSVRSTDF